MILIIKTVARSQLSSDVWAAGQFVMSGFLDFKMAPWKRSCVTRTVAIVPTLIIAVVFQASHKLDQLNQLLNILQSIMLPFAIIPVSVVNSCLQCSVLVCKPFSALLCGYLNVLGLQPHLALGFKSF